MAEGADHRRVEVDEIAGRHDEVGADAADELEALVELAVADERADVHVRDLRDRVALERARPVLHADDDLLEREGVSAPDHAPAERERGPTEERGARDTLDRLSARDDLGGQGGRSRRSRYPLGRGPPRRHRARHAARDERHQRDRNEREDHRGELEHEHGDEVARQGGLEARRDEPRQREERRERDGREHDRAPPPDAPRRREGREHPARREKVSEAAHQ